MNRERLLELADEIENPQKLLKLGFDMGDFVAGDSRRRFPSVACIGGYACLLWGDPGDSIDSETAARVLDLNGEDAGKLFFNNDEFIVKTDGLVQNFCGEKGITRAQAASAIRRMANKGGK